MEWYREELSANKVFDFVLSTKNNILARGGSTKPSYVTSIAATTTVNREKADGRGVLKETAAKKKEQTDEIFQLFWISMDTENTLELIAVSLTAIGGIWAFFKWSYPGLKEARTIKKDSKKYAERYQSALANELDKSNLPASNALDSFSVKLTDTFVSLSLSETWKSDTK